MNLISLSIQVKHPRHEYVGLGMGLMPYDYVEFFRLLDQAATDAYKEHSDRYRSKPNEMLILVQDGKAVISRLFVHVREGKIDRQHLTWRCDHASPLYEVYLQFRYLRLGLFRKYCEKRYRVLSILRKRNFDFQRHILRKQVIGDELEGDVVAVEGSPEFAESDESKLLKKINDERSQIASMLSQ